jgi:hypothetical protein
MAIVETRVFLAGDVVTDNWWSLRVGKLLDFFLCLKTVAANWARKMIRIVCTFYCLVKLFLPWNLNKKVTFSGGIFYT